ncbi:hypothetical protein TrRE_jg9095, partial [Triparma retinervis]
ILLTFALFILPQTPDHNFHLHHWLSSWFLGLHCNLPLPYSALVQAFLWGGYVNGVTAWGRGAMLGCEEVYWTGQVNYCDLVPRNWTETGDDDDGGGVPPYVPENWRECPK